MKSLFLSVFLVTFAFAGLPAAAVPTWSAAIAGAVPPVGIAGGQENGKPLVVCRANYGGGVHPGKVIGNTCNIGWGVKEVALPSFDVLRGNPAEVQWLAGQNGSVPSNAMEGGVRTVSRSAFAASCTAAGSILASWLPVIVTSVGAVRLSARHTMK
jgi:hypothetical protein